MKKRILSLSLALALIAGMVGCGPKTPSASSGQKDPSTSSSKSDASQTELNWPKGTVNVILPYSAGGDTDTYCRALFQRVGEKIGATFVVTNMTGGSGVVAAKDVMARKNDGYSLLFTHTGAALVQEATETVDFSYTNDFANCCTVAIDETYSLVALAKDGQYGQYSRGWESLEDLIADAKANEGIVRYSTVFGSTTQYVGQMLERDAGVKFDNIDVGSDAASRMAALLGGQVDLLAVNYMNVKDYIENGDLICLGVMAAQPVEGIDVKTFVEQGCPSVISAKKYEIKFPVGTDEAIIEYLSAICKEVTEDPSFAQVLNAYFAKPFYRDAATMNVEDPAEVEALKAGLAG